MNNYWKNAPWKPRAWQEEALPIIINSIKSGTKRPVVSAIMGAGKSIMISELVYQALQNITDNQKIIICAPIKDLINQLTGTISFRCGNNVGKFFSDEKDPSKKIIVTTFASSKKLAVLLESQNLKVSMLIGDEIHGTETDHFKEAMEIFKPNCQVGFTATPFRSDDKETLSLWDKVVYSYSAKQALQDKVIVPWKLVHWNGLGSDDTDEVCLNMIKSMSKTGPGVVNALNIQDAEHYSMYLDANGIKSGTIHSGMDQEHKDFTLKCLKEGTIACVVHVSMLAEGVDLPYLMWSVLRRPVGARVRFVQEVGRPLRAFPGKEYVLIGDPHDLFSKFTLANPEKLGEVLSDEEQEYEEILVLLEEEIEKRNVIRKMPPAVAYDHVDSYLISFLSILRTYNICPPPTTFDIEMKRGGSPSKAQLQTIQKVTWSSKYLPKEIREPFKLLLGNAHLFNRGTCSDLISILMGLAKGSEKSRKDPRPYKKHWKMPKINFPMPEFPAKQLLFVMEKN
tara:strand:- start:589 stop:2115 length:1527 start_codon:yes stop_codon:yes gene_type:complete